MGDPGTFDDFEPETFEDAAIEQYAAEIAAAVAIFNVPILEPGEFRETS